MAQKTVADTGSVDGFVNALADETKRSDSRRLIALMQEVTGEAPVLWGTMIGFGAYHYRYDSGREGDMFLIGFAPRKTEFSIYVTGCHLPGVAGQAQHLLSRLGKHRMGKGCLYVKRLTDIDMDVLRDLCALSVTALREMYPDKA